MKLREETPSILHGLLGSLIEINMVSAPLRRGIVNAVDPESCTIVLAVPHRSEAGLAGGWELILGHNIIEIKVLSPPDTNSLLLNLRLSEALNVDCSAIPDAKVKTGSDPTDALALFAAHRIPAVVEDGIIVILGGILRLNPPYTSAGCESANPTVLYRVQELLENVASERR